jgi:hypothetical protein
MIYDHLKPNEMEGVVIRKINHSWDIVIPRNWTGCFKKSLKGPATLRRFEIDFYQEILNRSRFLIRQGGLTNLRDKRYYLGG